MQTLKSRATALALCAASAAGLAGCANAPVPPSPQALFADALFRSAPDAPDTRAVFMMSPAMRAYADRELSAVARWRDPRHALIDALYTSQRSGLALSYDASKTRNASEAFAARAGNCLSLVIMTASFARHMGLPVSFQAVATEDFYSRSGGIYLASGHVNLVLGLPSGRAALRRSENDSLMIDFLPQSELRGQRTRQLDERTIVAMYFNNLAAESLTAGRVAQAYVHARAALLADPGFYPASNTLGVIYSRAGHPAQAKSAFRHALVGEPDNLAALSNLVQLLDGQGRGAEGTLLAARLRQLQPVPPFQHFNLGRAAMERGDWAGALDHFERELRLQPYQDEVHFWTAQAHFKLGRTELAARHLRSAVQHSLTPGTHDRYAAKLAHLRHDGLQ